MKRLEFMTLIGGAAAALPVATGAQLKMLRVVSVSGQPRSVGFWQTFEQRMAELGYLRTCLRTA
jgi:hypothetical protein